MRPRPPASSPRQRASSPIPSPAAPEPAAINRTPLVKIMRALPIVLGLLLISSRPATAQTFSVPSSPAKMTINTAVAGSQPTSVTNTATTYNVRVSRRQGIKHITAQIDTPMPAGTTLQLSMVPPAGATSPGLVTLTSTAAQSIVNNIANVN